MTFIFPTAKNNWKLWGRGISFRCTMPTSCNCFGLLRSHSEEVFAKECSTNVRCEECTLLYSWLGRGGIVFLTLMTVWVLCVVTGWILHGTAWLTSDAADDNAFTIPIFHLVSPLFRKSSCRYLYESHSFWREFSNFTPASSPGCHQRGGGTLPSSPSW